MYVSKFNYILGIPDRMPYVLHLNEVERKKIESLDLKEIIPVDFPENRYFRTQTNKKQIVLHHTVSGLGVDGDISWWIKDTQRIATSIIVDWKGDKYQLFSSKYWAHHLGVKIDDFTRNGVKGTTNEKLNKESIGIEIDAWGGLIKYKESWYPAKWDDKLKQNIANLKVKPIKDVVIFPNGYRGFYGFEKYTDEQIEAVRKLLIYFGETHDIPLKYNDGMWDVSKDALGGKSGVWSHTSYRRDKSDCYPDERLISMLKTLK